MVGRRVGRAIAVAAALFVGAAAFPRPANAHPLHTTLAEVTYDPAARTVTISLRVFVDDFGAAVQAATGAAVGDDGLPPARAMLHYVADRFAIAPRGGAPLALTNCGLRRSGVLLFFCLRAPSDAPLAGGRAASRLLTEHFDDQVNIVQVSDGGSRRTLLFTAGAGTKAIR